jgi:hypothetical protein
VTITKHAANGADSFAACAGPAEQDVGGGRNLRLGAAQVGTVRQTGTAVRSMVRFEHLFDSVSGVREPGSEEAQSPREPAVCPPQVPDALDWDDLLEHRQVASRDERDLQPDCWVWDVEAGQWQAAFLQEWLRSSAGWWASICIGEGFHAQHSIVHSWRLRPVATVDQIRARGQTTQERAERQQAAIETAIDQLDGLDPMDAAFRSRLRLWHRSEYKRLSGQ